LSSTLFVNDRELRGHVTDQRAMSCIEGHAVDRWDGMEPTIAIPIPELHQLPQITKARLGNTAAQQPGRQDRMKDRSEIDRSP
jgi:hypothetical protein